MIRTTTYILLLCLSLSGCGQVQHIAKMDAGYTVPGQTNTIQPDPAVEQMIAPYKVKIENIMSEVIGHVKSDLTKRQPESTMGNWVSDALLNGARANDLEGDFCINNYGGMRVPVITAGPFTLGELFELSPFENMLVSVEVPGYIVDSIFQLIAFRDGWPVSANIRMVMSQKKVVSVTIDGAAIDPQKIYHVVMPDYVANGGDDARFLVSLPRKQCHLTMRDILKAEIQKAEANGQMIESKIEGRITVQ